MSASVLIVDDDPICREHATATLAAAGYTTHAVATLADARAALRAGRDDIVLCDLELPDGSGVELAGELRAGGRRAIAMSADITPSRRATLRDAGFATALEKPIRAETLVATVGELVGRQAAPARKSEPERGETAMLDDAAALLVAGNADVATGLRRLLRDELPAQRNEIAAALARDDRAAARAVLHRLRASAGFCGARALGRAAEALSDALDRGQHDSAHAQFERVLDKTLAALTTRTSL